MGYWQLVHAPSGYMFSEKDYSRKITDTETMMTEYLGDVIRAITAERLPDYINDLYEDSHAYRILSEEYDYVDEDIPEFEDCYEEVEQEIVDSIHPGRDFTINGLVFEWHDEPGKSFNFRPKGLKSKPKAKRRH